jgi:histidinol-phosphate aminotransferase
MAPRPRAHLSRLTPYEWEASAGEIAAAAGLPETAIVRFDTNTTAWPPLAWEQTVLDAARMPANEYPHPSNEPLRSALAQQLGVEPEQVVVTCGADEALLLVATVFLGPGRRALVADPSFSMFRVVTETVGGELEPVALDEGWDLPERALLAVLAKPEVTVAWLCSPNNPTGRLLDAGLVARAARAAPDTVIVVDEAYYEIAGQTVMPLLREHPNLLVVRTFSKGYGLAGARVGYAVGARPLVQLLEMVRLPQNLTVFGVTAACRALADQDGLRARVESIVRERERLVAGLEARAWEVLSSTANFVLGRPPVVATDLSRWLQGAGLIVRSYGHNPRLRDWLRIAVRAPEEDDRLLARLDTYRG